MHQIHTCSVELPPARELQTCLLIPHVARTTFQPIRGQVLVEELLLPLFSDEWEEMGEVARVLDGIVCILQSKLGCSEGAKTAFLLF